jgi:hypothetical protein
MINVITEVPKMLMRFADDMETVIGGDLIYLFYKRVLDNKDVTKFPELLSFKLHDIINYVKLHPEFTSKINTYLNK